MPKTAAKKGRGKRKKLIDPKEGQTLDGALIELDILERINPHEYERLKRESMEEPKKKKKNPQKKIKQFFAVTKPKMGPVEKNFQGKPMDQCFFSDQIGNYVWQPEVWGNTRPNKNDPHRHSIYHRVTCEWCFLTPCIVEEKREEIFEMFDEITNSGVDDKLHLYGYAHDKAWAMLKEVFGPRYVRKFRMPQCLEELISQWSDLPHEERDPHQEPHPDDELVAGSLDAKEYYKTTGLSDEEEEE
jgi:hypothetical protein